MYENITYDQLKELPDDQKIIALKELKTIYPDNKDLAKHLDIAHIAINNMVGKYLEGKQVGRKKMTPEEKAQAKTEREAEKKRLKEQEKQETMTQQITTNQDNVPQPTNPNATIVPIINESIKINLNSFSINLNKDMLGEEAISRLSGIANSLLKENQYRVNLIIEETGEV